MRTFPEWATFSGDHRYDDRLSDESRAARDAVDAHQRETLVRLLQIDRAKLTATDRVSYDLMLAKTQERIEVQQFRRERALFVCNIDRGDYSSWSDLDSGKVTPEEVQAKRLEALPRCIATCDRWLVHLANRLAYERAMLAGSGLPASPGADATIGSSPSPVARTGRIRLRTVHNAWLRRHTSTGTPGKRANRACERLTDTITGTDDPPVSSSEPPPR